GAVASATAGVMAVSGVAAGAVASATAGVRAAAAAAAAGQTVALAAVVALVMACGGPAATPASTAGGPGDGATSGEPGSAEVGGPNADGAEPDELVTIELLADTTAAAPGQSMTLAVRFDIAPGWHLYWENPGESGLATEIEIAAPALDVGPVRYPGPVAFTSPGPVTSYGYADRVLLSAPARVVAADGPSVPIAAVAYWLACREVCVRGSARASLALPVADRDHAPAPTNTELFAAHRARLPEPFEDLAGARVGLERPDQAGPGGEPALALTIVVPEAAALRFFPAADLQIALIDQSESGQSESGQSESGPTPAEAVHTALVVHLRADAVPDQVRGVVAVTPLGADPGDHTGHGARYYHLAVPAP
ncbi:protein-disulfide reductase DsbD domain-containing protein, partial [Haliangium sp.]|uniref:protein-disulfide reductase DsbD domain-containing protein n=2 Tax=Haliangium sp. TaxID=2663208 RepID=UPI003D13A269